MLRLLHGLALCQCLEDSRRIHSDLLVSRHKRQIRIKPCSLLIIVSGSDLRDIFDAVCALLCDQAQFGVYLVSLQSIDDLAPCLLKHTGPADVVLFVKAGTQLYQHHDFLSVLRRLTESLDDLALFCQTVQRHLDRDHTVVLRRFVEHIQERTDRLIRIGQEFVLLFDLL